MTATAPSPAPAVSSPSLSVDHVRTLLVRAWDEGYHAAQLDVYREYRELGSTNYRATGNPYFEKAG